MAGTQRSRSCCGAGTTRGQGLRADESGNSADVTHYGIDGSDDIMIILGVILLLIGYFTGLSLLYTIGGILVVVGVVLWLLGAVGRPVGGRKAWY